MEESKSYEKTLDSFVSMFGEKEIVTTKRDDGAYISKAKDGTNLSAKIDNYIQCFSAGWYNANQRQEPQGWVSVDNPPNKKEHGFSEVFVNSEFFGVQQAMYNNVTKIFLLQNYKEIKDVTHWQPLPSAP